MANSVTAGFRLSAQQERVWAQLYGAEAGTSSASATILIEGPLETERLRDALRRLISRHEILRTLFHRQAGLKLPFQIIRDSVEPAWNLASPSDPDLTEQRVRLEHELTSVPFDLEHGPTVRALLVELAPDRHALTLSVPAIGADARSLQNLVQELGLEYSGIPANEEAMQYADVVEWQNEILEGEDTRAGRDFWRDHFRNLDLIALDSLTLPFRTKTGAQGFRPEVCEFTLNAAIVSSRRERNGSLPDFLLTCWYLLFSRLMGTENVTIGCGFDGRKYRELEDALGLFAKFLPIRISLQSGASFDTLLRQVQEFVSEAHQWQESFAWGKVEGLPDANNLVLPLAYEYRQAPATQAFGDISFSLQHVSAPLERYALKLVAVSGERGVGLEFHYDGARFERGAIERIAAYYETLLSAAVQAPETPVSRLPLVPERERQQLLVEWNQTAASYPEDRCLHQLFEAQAARTPERTALVFNEQALTYAQWNQQSNRLAHYLRFDGAGRDALVGLCLDRSAQMMVALLAILKAGGAYVPLNPDNPKARLAQQLSGATALITESKLLAQMPEFAGKTLCLDRDEQLWAAQPVTNPDPLTSPDHLVYVIYTSGSTGVPKGVAVRHRNLVNYGHFLTRRLELDRYPEGLQFATVSTIGADLGNTCIFPAMISGGCLHVIAYDTSTDAERFARYTRAHPIDVLKIVPSHLEALLHSPDAKQILPRRYLITGGETLTPQLVEKIQALEPGCEIFNHYGPTETTVGSLTLRLKDYDYKQNPGHTIPIGRPIANTQVYILDGQLQLVPQGVIGELYIAGAGVTAGYLDQAEKTAERFLKNPFSPNPDSRMYRTGDLARYLAGGNVEFLGRADDQVKIRGFRIELGEVEAILGQHPAVKQAVVLARADERGEKRLLGYVVARDASLTADTLRSYLKQQLPEYMVPQALVLVAKLPLNPNGKIDRQALPQPEQVEAKAHVAPQTPTEEVVAGIWTEVLRRDRISIHDNFFDLGGHSLMATQIVSRIREKFQVELAMRILFEQPTIRGLALAIEAAKQNGGLEDEPSIVPVAREAYRARHS